VGKVLFGTTIPDAADVPYDDSVTMFGVDNVQEAIESIIPLVTETSKAFTFCSYNGNANAQRWLEFFNGIASDDAPITVIGALNIRAIVARTVASSATCTIGFYNVAPVTPVLLYTVTMAGVKEVVLSAPSPGLATLPAGGKLAVKVDTGSISKPHLYFTGQGG